MLQKILKNTSNASLSGQAATNEALDLALAQMISNDSLDALFAPFRSLFHEKTSIAVAVSGGSDSMALCLMLSKWARRKNHVITALTVDHGLRKSSKKESQMVSNWLANWKVSHRILNWEGEKPVTGIQEAARKARYQLLARWCLENNFTVLMTAHHLDDQVETFLMRASSGSGLDGLASMNSIVQLNNLFLVRPLLGVSKALLREFLREKQQTWIEDPSNQRLEFQRTRIRQTIEKLENRGLSSERMFRLSGHFNSLRKQLADVVTVFFERAVRIFPDAYLVVHLDVLKHLPDPIFERVLIRIISELSGKFYPPRHRSIKHVMDNIKSSEMSNFTLGGCFFVYKGSTVIVCRDPRSISKRKVVAGDKFYWDGLFDVEIFGPEGPKGWLGALGKKGWLEIVQKCPDLKHVLLPYSVKITLPTLFDDYGVIHVPGLKYRNPGQHNLFLSIKRNRYETFSACKEGKSE